MADLRFDGRVAVVTGAGRGIGRAHAMALASRGANVVVNDLGTAMGGGERDPAPARSVVDEIVTRGGLAVPDTNDVSTSAGGEDLIATALDAFGAVDIVINNAGNLDRTVFPGVELDGFNSQLAVHAAGSFNVTRAVWPHMLERGYGRVVLTTSSAWFGGDNAVSYGTAKGAVVGLARSLAAAGEPHGIRTNVIAPFAWTRMMAASGVSEDSEMATQLRPELVSEVVAYLAHEECSVNGEIYSTGGGRVSRIFIAETAGYSSGDLTAEDVRDNLAEIRSMEHYFVPTSMMTYTPERQAMLDRIGSA